MHWRSFSNAVAELSAARGQADGGIRRLSRRRSAHRPVKLAATASSGQLAQEDQVHPGRHDVPAGIQAVIERACLKAGIPFCRTVGRVPHYVADDARFPAASAALLDVSRS